MGHTNRWCPVVGATIDMNERVQGRPCPFCGTRLPADYERVDISDEARQQGEAWLADRRSTRSEPSPPPDPEPPPDPQPAVEESSSPFIVETPSPALETPAGPEPLPDPAGPLPPAPTQRSGIPWRIVLGVGFGVVWLISRFVAPSGDLFDDFEPGDCFNDNTDYVSVETEVEELDKVDCGDLHFYEFLGEYQSVALAAPAYPTEAEMAEEALPACGRMLEEYTGVPYGQSFIDVTWYVPTRAVWRDTNSARVFCAVYTIEPATQTVAGRGAEMLIGCFTWEDIFVDCDQPHGFEQIAFAYYPANFSDPYPGDDDITTFAEEVCEHHFGSFVDPATASVAIEWWWSAPDSIGWEQQGNRVIQCFVSAVSGEELTGSLSVYR